MSGREQTRWFGLQLIRGVAALLVVFSHLPYWAAGAVLTPELDNTVQSRVGTVAVLVFFALSGIVIGLSHGKEIGAPWPERPGLFGAFCLKRFFRIYPLYWFSAAVNLALFRGGLATWDGNVVQMRTAGQFVAAGFLFSTLTPIAPAWSLAHEVFFYALFGLCLLLPLPGFVLAGLFAAVTGAVAAGLAGYTSHFVSPINLFFLGGLLLVSLRHLYSGSRPLRVAAGLLCLPPLAWATLRTGTPVREGANLLLCFAGVTLLFVPALGRDDPEAPPRPVPGWLRTLGFGLGDIGYSLYLLHLPVQAVLFRWIGPPVDLWKSAAYLAVPVVVACASYRWIERPVLAWGRDKARAVRNWRWAPRPTATPAEASRPE